MVTDKTYNCLLGGGAKIYYNSRIVWRLVNPYKIINNGNNKTMK